jgi:hypothetical protein
MLDENVAVRRLPPATFEKQKSKIRAVETAAAASSRKFTRELALASALRRQTAGAYVTPSRIAFVVPPPLRQAATLRTRHTFPFNRPSAPHRPDPARRGSSPFVSLSLSTPSYALSPPPASPDSYKCPTLLGCCQLTVFSTNSEFLLAYDQLHVMCGACGFSGIPPSRPMLTSATGSKCSWSPHRTSPVASRYSAATILQDDDIKICRILEKLLPTP